MALVPVPGDGLEIHAGQEKTCILFVRMLVGAYVCENLVQPETVFCKWALPGAHFFCFILPDVDLY